MKRKAIEALIKMGMPANTRGFKYIAEIIEKYAENEEWMYGKLTLLYEVVGGKDGVHWMNVERCIRHAFQTVLTKGNFKEVNKYLTFEEPTNGNLLAVFYLRLKEE